MKRVTRRFDSVSGLKFGYLLNRVEASIYSRGGRVHEVRETAGQPMTMRNRPSVSRHGRPAVSPCGQPTISLCDRLAASLCDRPAMSTCDRPAVSPGDRPAVSTHDRPVVLSCDRSVASSCGRGAWPSSRAVVRLFSPITRAASSQVGPPQVDPASNFHYDK